MPAVNIKLIRIDGGTQSRQEIDQSLVEEYIRNLEAGDKFPPVVVFNDGVDTYLADGFHRYFAHLKNNKASIEADIRQGTLRDAVFYSLQANAQHGKRRTNADKEKSVQTMLDDFEWTDWTNTAIADHCAVSISFVGSVRKPETKEKQKENMKKHIEKKFQKEDTSEEVSAAKVQIEELVSMNEELEDKLALARLPGSEKDAELSTTLIIELREENKMLALELKAVTISRDQFQKENAELKKQVAAQTKQIKKAK